VSTCEAVVLAVLRALDDFVAPDFVDRAVVLAARPVPRELPILRTFASVFVLLYWYSK
jgi:hypothetical protein